MKMVSVIVVNYNGQKWIKKCFDSLLDQTYKNFEIIFVDNNSNDNSIDFIEKNYKDERIKIIKSDENLGFAGGNNLGIKEAKGGYILFLNIDTWMENSFIMNILDFYKNNSYDILGAWEECYNQSKRKNRIVSFIDFLGHPVGLQYEHKKKQGFYLSGACLFFKKNLYFETKGLDNNFFMYCEEVDWFWRLNLLGKSFCHVENLFVHHAGSGGQEANEVIKYNTFLWRNQNTLQMLLKNYSAITLTFILPIYILQNIIEIIFFLIILKPEISLSYLQGWYFNIKSLKVIMAARKWVQLHRQKSDIEVIKKMYFGFGKIKHLLYFFRIQGKI
jgi:GT2 family glycosyltransferase